LEVAPGKGESGSRKYKAWGSGKKVTRREAGWLASLLRAVTRGTGLNGHNEAGGIVSRPMAPLLEVA
jgi:hypothetical protein